MAFKHAVSRNIVLELDRILSNLNSTVRIYSNTPGSKFRTVGFIQGGMSFTGGNDFVKDFEDYGNSIRTGMRKFRQIAGISQTAQKVLGEIPGGSNTVLQAAFGSYKSYVSSSMPTFSIQFMLLAYKAGVNPLDDATTLQAMVLPLKQTTGTITPPLNYQSTITSSSSGTAGFDGQSEFNSNGSSNQPLSGPGTLNVALGQYFYGTGLICSSYGFQCSEEVVEDGTPLYTICNATFEAKRAYDIIEFRRFFRGISNNFEAQTIPDVLSRTIDSISGFGADLDNGFIANTATGVSDLIQNPSAAIGNIGSASGQVISNIYQGGRGLLPIYGDQVKGY